MLGSTIDIKINELTESNRQLRRRIFDLHTIFEITRDFNSVLNYDTLVDSFMLTSMGQVGASRASLFLPPSISADHFQTAFTKGLPDETDLSSGRQIQINGQLSEYLHSQGRPLSITELKQEMDGTEEVSKDISILTVAEDGIVIPLTFKESLKGFLAIGGKITSPGFTGEDIEFLSVLANQFVVALENARLYESEKKVLNELRLAQKQLVQTERSAAIGELSAKIAHEVNNPLSIITNYLTLCRRNLDDPVKTVEYLEITNNEIARIARIVRQLLDFNRPNSSPKRSLDIRTVVDDIIKLVEWQMADTKIEVKRVCQPGLPQVLGSAEQLKQVFLNLMLNAKEAMPDGGELHITAEVRDDNVVIIFCDTGQGIPKEHLAKIFEPFYTTREDDSGTGLGLSVCFGIIAEHGGKITAGNNDLGGACFEVFLPADK